MNSSFYHALIEMDQHHWWSVNRRRLAVQIFRNFQRKQPEGVQNVLDLGCGMGLLLEAFERNAAHVYGVDPSKEAVHYCHTISDADVRVGSLPDQIPFAAGSFDFIACMDVLEHIDEDNKALTKIRSLLRTSESTVLLTVPAYPALWGRTDVLAHHKRRYQKKDLYEKLRCAGFQIDRLTYFNTFLFLPISLTRLLSQVFHLEIDELCFTPGLINHLCSLIFHLELALLKYINYPFGVSLLAICHKES